MIGAAGNVGITREQIYTVSVHRIINAITDKHTLTANHIMQNTMCVAILTHIRWAARSTIDINLE